MRQVGMPDVEFGEEYGAGAATLHVAYCKHAYGLGEHYNSLQPLGGGSEADEEEVQGQEDD
jgi:OTU domain-containing protein 6